MGAIPIAVLYLYSGRIHLLRTMKYIFILVAVLWVGAATADPAAKRGPDPKKFYAMRGRNAFSPATMGRDAQFDPATMGRAGGPDPKKFYAMRGRNAFSPATMGRDAQFDPAT